MKTFYLPVDYWAEKEALGTFAGGDVPLNVRIGILTASLKGKRQENANLADSSFLVKTKLSDGEDGYQVGELTLSLASLFSDPVISSGARAVRVVNATGEDAYKLEELLAVLEVLGAKPVPPRQEAPLPYDCLVSANDEQILARMSTVFNCEKSGKKPEAFDIELVLGKGFVERF